jgi:hypothetical protein
MNEFLKLCSLAHDVQSSKVSLHPIIMLQIPLPNLMSKTKSPSLKKKPHEKSSKKPFYDQSLMKKAQPISSLNPTYWTNLTNLLSQYCPLSLIYIKIY